MKIKSFWVYVLLVALSSTITFIIAIQSCINDSALPSTSLEFSSIRHVDKAPLPWKVSQAPGREKLLQTSQMKIVNSRGLKGFAGKVFDTYFKDEAGNERAYVIRSPFPFLAKKCVDAYRLTNTWDEEILKKTFKEVLRVKRPPQWYLFDLIAYHLDRLLGFHITPLTTSFTYSVKGLIEGLNLNDKRHNFTTKEELWDAYENCYYLNTALYNKEQTFGTAQYKIQPSNENRLDVIRMFDGRKQLHCIAKGDCDSSPSSLGKVYIMDFLLGTTDRKVNTWIYGKRLKKGQFDQEKSRAILLDNDAQWDRRAWDLEMEQVTWCQERFKEDSPRKFCLHPGIIKNLQPYRTRSISEDLRNSLRQELLYDMDEIFREYVDKHDWFYLDKGVERLIYVLDRYEFPTNVEDEPIIFEEFLA